VNEHSIMITVNVGLADRFKNLMSDGNNW
jgi:hypothetical protein